MRRNRQHRRRWFRYRLSALAIAVLAVCVFSAANLSASRPQLMFRYRAEDGGAEVYAQHFGWPLTYLRVPAGEHASRIPADFFMPGLLVDLGVTAIVILIVLLLSKWIHGARARRVVA